MARRRSGKIPKPHYLVNLGLSLAVLFVYGLAGLQINSQTSAATANPYGYADYCALENNNTVIYGWAADPNAGSLSGPSVTINAGGQAATTSTNRAGYRDGFVNSWIDQNRAGDPKPGTYGFRAALSGLYKGSRPTITGTILNEGPGSSVILSINNNSYTDGDGTKPFFGSNVIPEACLANVPAGTTPPPATPAPTPAPRPPASPGRTNGGAPATPAPAGPPLSSSADGAVTPGTLAAQIKIPAGNAASLRVDYGESPVKLDQSTADQPTNGAETVVTLTGLKPARNYSFQIVRTGSDGKTTTSGLQKFETLGFIIALHFVDNQKKGVQGIPSTISVQDKRVTSDDNGNVQFTAVPEGSHTVAYTYRDEKFTKLVTASSSIVSPAESAAANVVTIDYSINIEEGIDKSGSPAKSGGGVSTGIWIALGILLLAVVGAVFALIRRGRKRAADQYYSDTPAPPLPEYTPSSYSPKPLPPNNQQPAEHMGESLKDMVLRSMREEAQRRDNDQK